MFSFLKKYRYILVVGFLITFALWRIALHTHAHSADPVHRCILEVTAPLQDIVTKGLLSVKGVWERYMYLVNLQEENRLLREIIAELRKERVQLREAAIANLRLRELLAFKESSADPLLPAKVIGQDMSGWFQSLLIDAGEKDGVREAMVVVSPAGVIGQIIETSGHYSRVLLLTDHSSEIAGLTQRTRARGIVEGIGDRFCRFKYLHRSEDVRDGDLVLSSGMDKIFPTGVLIGTITRVRRETSGLFQEAELQPAVDFYTLEEVLIILRNQEPAT